MKKCDDPKKTMGVWRSAQGKQRYRVDMAIFELWSKTHGLRCRQKQTKSGAHDDP